MSGNETQVPVSVKLDAAALDSSILKIITEGAIGKEIERAITTMLSKKQNYPYRKTVETCIENTVQEYVKQTVLQTIRKEPFESQIRTLIQERVTADFATDLFNRAWDKFLGETYK